MIKIQSFSNDKIKFASGLKDKKNRLLHNKIFIEGFRELSRAIQSKKLKFTHLYYSPECFLGMNESTLIDRLNQDRVLLIEIPKNIMEKISMRDRPDGLIGIAELPDYSFSEQKVPNGNLFLLIEGVEKPGNLGTILRTAEGAGVDSVIVSDTKLDLFNPNVIRSSTGTVFTQSILQGSLDEILNFFIKKNIKIVLITPEAVIPYYNFNLKDPTLLIFGNEQYGLSQFLRNSDSFNKISIPMKGEADSLNLAMSVGIILYDSLRQRNSL
jgi:RNA methyltransferase, TrmH family